MNASLAVCAFLTIPLLTLPPAASATKGDPIAATKQATGSAAPPSTQGSGVLVEDYGSAALSYDNGMPWATSSGIYDFSESYSDKDRTCTTVLDPVTATEVPLASSNFLTTLEAAFPGSAGWSYATAVSPLSAGSLIVKTYDASAQPAGAEFHVRYQPGAGDPVTIHWIQVVTSNHPTNQFLKASHGAAENAVDIPAGQGNPYHHGPIVGANDDEIGGYDFSWRLDSANDHDFEAELWLVTGPAIGAGPGLITLHRPGIRWGWRNLCLGGAVGRYIAASNAPVTFAANGTFAPGAQRQASAITPASMALSKGPNTAPVQLAQAQLSINIDNALEFDHKGSRFTVVGGTGQFQPFTFAGIPVSTSTFQVIGGHGTIHWASGAMATHLNVQVSSSGFSDVLATVDGTGAINFSNNSVTLDPGGISIENVAFPSLSRWGVLLLLAGLGAAALSKLKPRRAAMNTSYSDT